MKQSERIRIDRTVLNDFNRKRPFTKERFFKEIARVFLTNTKAKLFEIDPKDLEESRTYFLEGKSFSTMAQEKGYYATKIIGTKKNILRPFRIIVDRVQRVCEENERIREENEQIREENNKLKEEILQVREEMKEFKEIEIKKNGLVLQDELFVPSGAVPVNSKVAGLFVHQQIEFISEESCLIKMNLKNVRTLGSVCLKEIQTKMKEVPRILPQTKIGTSFFHSENR